MTIEANAWNKNNSSWREFMDSATVSIDVSVGGEVSFTVIAGSIGSTQLANGSVTLAKLSSEVLANFMTRGKALAMMARADMN